MSVSIKAIKKDVRVRISIGIITFVLIFLISMLIPKSARADTGLGYKNYFYVNVINNVLAVIKPSTNEISMKTTALAFLGLDTRNPITIISKEIAYLDKSEFGSDVSNQGTEEADLITFILKPFNLDDKQVKKIETENKNTNVIADLYNPLLKQTLNKAKPRVLIYHSHATESYRASDKDKTKNAFNLDSTKNVCAVGDVIKEELEKNYGIAVIHDKTLHNVGDYNGSYKKSGITIDKYLKAYGDFDLVIDLHRDGIENKNLVTTKINGENVAQIMFVMAKGNPRYAEQKKLVDSMIGISNKIYPNLLTNQEISTVNRGIAFYNQNKSDSAILIEVGTYTNTIAEVKNTGLYLSRVFAEQLNGKK